MLTSNAHVDQGVECVWGGGATRALPQPCRRGSALSLPPAGGAARPAPPWTPLLPLCKVLHYTNSNFISLAKKL